MCLGAVVMPGNSCRRRRVGCHRVSWGGWMTGSSANKLAAERADTAVVAALIAGPRGEIPAEQRCASKSGSPAKDLHVLGTRRLRGEGWLGDRLQLGQGVCREVAPSQNCSSMS